MRPDATPRQVGNGQWSARRAAPPDGCTDLKGYPVIYRVQVRDYRVCYRVEDGRLLVLVVAIGLASVATATTLRL